MPAPHYRRDNTRRSERESLEDTLVSTRFVGIKKKRSELFLYNNINNKQLQLFFLFLHLSFYVNIKPAPHIMRYSPSNEYSP